MRREALSPFPPPSEFVVKPFHGHQFLVGSLLPDSSMVHHHDPIRLKTCQLPNRHAKTAKKITIYGWALFIAWKIRFPGRL